MYLYCLWLSRPRHPWLSHSHIHPTTHPSSTSSSVLAFSLYHTHTGTGSWWVGRAAVCRGVGHLAGQSTYRADARGAPLAANAGRLPGAQGCAGTGLGAAPDAGNARSPGITAARGFTRARTAAVPDTCCCAIPQLLVKCGERCLCATMFDGEGGTCSTTDCCMAACKVVPRFSSRVCEQTL